VVGPVPKATAEDVAAAVERARDARAAWVHRPLSARADVLRRLHDVVLDQQAALLDAVQVENGKARRHAFEEVLDVAMTARYYADHAAEHLSSRSRTGALPLLTRTVEHRRPVGVVGIISPWNYPLTLAVSDALPALVAGNAVVLKPAEATPFSALLARDLLREAGLPKGLFQVVPGEGATVGPALTERVDFIGFTGSTETGRTVATQAAERLIPSSLELGGKNPLIVFDDADLDRAVEGALRGCFASSGQLCLSFERVYVQSGIADAFTERFAARAHDLRVDASFDWDAEMGPLVDGDHLAKVEEHVESAREAGASVLAGGERRPEAGPFGYAPTVLADVPPDHRVAREETFGPVASVFEFEADDDAVARANDSEYGLNASVWTEDVEFGREVARRIDCGTVNVNEAYGATWGSLDAPMGGVGDSGLGRRHGREGVQKYTETQTVAEQRVAPVGVPPGVPAEWYARGMTAALRVLKHARGWWP
jgi:succinate-semialdehyde dehydrogenase/glutarate-semialdehyde dehydrogenase